MAAPLITLTESAAARAKSLIEKSDSPVLGLRVGVRGGEVTVTLVWEPPWTPERMSEDARLALGMI